MVTGCQEGAGQGGMPERVPDEAAGLTQDRVPDEAAGLVQGAQDRVEPPRFRLATSFFQRVRGLIGTKASKEILLLVPCKDVHTVGMRYAIDVAFIDQSGTVVLVRRDVGPGKRIACREAVAVLERSADAQSAWYECGDVVFGWCVSDADRERAPAENRSYVPDRKGVPGENRREDEGKERCCSMKQCPACNAVVFDDMDRCYGCLYQFDPESEIKEPRKASELGGLEGPQDAHRTEEVHEVIHKTRVPAPEIYCDAHGQTTLTVRLNLRLDFAPAQTASQDERCATVTNQTSGALSAITN